MITTCSVALARAGVGASKLTLSRSEPAGIDVSRLGPSAVATRSSYVGSPLSARLRSVIGPLPSEVCVFRYAPSGLLLATLSGKPRVRSSSFSIAWFCAAGGCAPNWLAPVSSDLNTSVAFERYSFGDPAAVDSPKSAQSRMMSTNSTRCRRAVSR